MPKLYAAANIVGRRLPKIVSPKGHAIADYITVGLFAVAAGLFWKSHRRAAVGALLCGGAELALNLTTDYPGGVAGMVTFPQHRRIDLGLSALTATMPELLGLRRGRSFFLIQSGVIATTANLTRFGPDRISSRRMSPVVA